MAELIFATGIKIKDIHTSYGVIFKLGVKVEDFIKFITDNTNEQGYCNIDLKQSKNGKWYMCLNDYVKNTTTEHDTDNIIQSGEDEIPF